MTALPLSDSIWNELAAVVARWRQCGETIAFTNGCFDVLHEGHVLLLERSRLAASRLIVAVNSDDYCRRTKGAARPIQSAAVRLQVVAGVSAADAVVVFDHASPARLLALIKPDVYVLGSDYRGSINPGAEHCGRIDFVERLGGFSTTELLTTAAPRPVVPASGSRKSEGPLEAQWPQTRERWGVLPP